ncbi:hypothetical protein SAMN05216257_101447 [Meinhardsimonia xiamenensis]|jgi:hypothetical protein|uniref:Lipid A deacylase LpxR family protein n=1 Tax=Meinhardsimonia xiamenensis TaxID=990712 RepID=A0A1G8YTU9_9RHOB|nr:lipid A-modifier LpxR family protein [Meinhardsimonia xiamenensis]PRX37424.1 uncharacterized protein DUF2219 [Meinhardsimonia xiamenensis]SDK05854.1 hypothetical protein SAMN05216257_101447 [Meinhardsimonia xiamenensis]
MIRFLRALPAVACLLLAVPSIAPAQDGRQTLGFGRLFNNDGLGDGRDRWRTGSYTVSWLRGREPWSGALPESMGEVLEYRFRGEIIAPANLASPAPGDRRYVGALSVGLHSHFERGRTRFSLGGDLVATGPMTGLGGFQEFVHDLFGMSSPAPALANQIPNAFHPTATASVTREIGMAGGAVRLMPFVEGQVGVETLVRAGADLKIGRAGSGGLWLRDVVTGQQYHAAPGAQGLSLTLGGDIAHVASSAYLPAGEPAVPEPTRTRLRAGLTWQGERSTLFYGVTWLGKEFQGQPEGQVVGSLSLKFRF